MSLLLHALHVSIFWLQTWEEVHIVNLHIVSSPPGSLEFSHPPESPDCWHIFPFLRGDYQGCYYLQALYLSVKLSTKKYIELDA